MSERDVARKREHGWIRFNEGDERWSMPDPQDPGLADAAHTARYSLGNLTQVEAWRLCQVVEAYHHLMTHPCGTEYAVGQLRAMRRALKTLPPPTEKEKPE